MHQEAAGIYARLADREQDRRQKSILRAKEREARKADQERQVADLVARARSLADRGDIAAAIDLLSQTRGLGDAGASTGAVAAMAIEREIEVLRGQLRRRQRRRLALIGAVVLVLAGAAVGWRLTTGRFAPSGPPISGGMHP
jgi:hypothetical protein